MLLQGGIPSQHSRSISAMSTHDDHTDPSDATSRYQYQKPASRRPSSFSSQAHGDDHGAVHFTSKGAAANAKDSPTSSLGSGSEEEFARTLAKGLDDIRQLPEQARNMLGRNGATTVEFTGGYQADAEEEVAANLMCPICLHILRKPVQTSCGHRFCQSCIELVLRKGPDPRCPEDRQPLDEVFRDRHCEREINCIPVRCRNFAKCQWRGKLRELEDHLKVCPFEKVACTNKGCPHTVERQHFNEHLAKECAHRLTVCKFCNQSIPHVMMKIHIEEHCQEAIISCTSPGCEKRLPRRQLRSHLSTECQAVEELCSMGCGQMIRRADFGPHCVEPSANAAHFAAFHGKLQGVEQELRRKDDLMEHQQMQIASLQSKVESNVRRGLQALDARVDCLAEDVRSQKTSSQNLGQSGAQGQLQRRVSNLEMDVHTTMRGQTEAKIVSGQQQSVCQEIAKQTDQLDLRVMELETTAYGGFLIWRIPNFSKLLDEAKRGIKTSHYSQPFYAGRYGYKACARLYVNGDGAGHGKYVSLFFVIMAGEYDAILQWPFNRRVTLSLLDQSPARHHVSETFTPDISSSSFQRPTSGLNVASGCPCFMSHQMLNSSAQQYLRDDTMFLKIKVETTGMEHFTS
ncbi:TNF receptor-associated factor 3-like isoform X2 [Sycon ciliatum]|uniref:TNF receptor-associated factor 3-like isoform X2 n=1 Tax=Sycon ciliatum TaxID=27933 RepID=UPI0031F5FF24